MVVLNGEFNLICSPNSTNTSPGRVTIATSELRRKAWISKWGVTAVESSGEDGESDPSWVESVLVGKHEPVWQVVCACDAATLACLYNKLLTPRCCYLLCDQLLARGRHDVQELLEEDRDQICGHHAAIACRRANIRDWLYSPID